MGRLGYTLTTKDLIEQGTVVGEYSDILTISPAIRTRARSTRGKKLFIDAEKYGNITRFINHSCDANCGFFEVQNQRHITVVVATTKIILPSEALSVDYGKDLWFECQCGSSKSRNA
ncbi:hypothetical protein AC1031_004070 [Aphanomyces cochlioides]|nr:hypothetical protein AC1031_004070 [Aphanomyces cochlioides]